MKHHRRDDEERQQKMRRDMEILDTDNKVGIINQTKIL